MGEWIRTLRTHGLFHLGTYFLKQAQASPMTSCSLKSVSFILASVTASIGVFSNEARWLLL